jgi:hypothetical protein
MSRSLGDFLDNSGVDMNESGDVPMFPGAALNEAGSALYTAGSALNASGDGNDLSGAPRSRPGASILSSGTKDDLQDASASRASYAECAPVTRGTGAGDPSHRSDPALVGSGSPIRRGRKRAS